MAVYACFCKTVKLIKGVTQDLSEKMIISDNSQLIPSYICIFSLGHYLIILSVYILHPITLCILLYKN